MSTALASTSIPCSAVVSVEATSTLICLVDFLAHCILPSKTLLETIIHLFNVLVPNLFCTIFNCRPVCSISHVHNAMDVGTAPTVDHMNSIPVKDVHEHTSVMKQGSSHQWWKACSINLSVPGEQPFISLPQQIGNHTFVVLLSTCSYQRHISMIGLN